MNGGVLLDAPVQRWACPNCPETDQTRGRPNRWHRCRGEGVHAGLLAPMVQAGTRARIHVVEPETPIDGARGVRFHQGRPIAAIVTERDEGTDCAVFPTVGRLVGAA